MGNCERRWDPARRAGIGAVLVLAVSCGGGGGGGGTAGGGTSGSIGNLGIVGHSPAADEIQVALDASIEVTFDGAIDPGAMNEEEFRLTKGTEPPIRGTFTAQQGGRTVVFTPDVPLEKATDYTYTLEPTLCDTSFRTLDRAFSFSFRSFDDVPPVVRSASVTNNQSNVSRTAGFTVQFDEPIAPASVNAASVTLKDTWGTKFLLAFTLQGGGLLVRPVADLPGSRTFVLALRGGAGGVEDIAGNALAKTWSVRFTSAADKTAPALVRSDPAEGATGVSPRARLEFVFDESMDPASYEPSGVFVRDAFLNDVPFTLTTSPDQKTVRLQPASLLSSGETYTVTFRSGAVGMTDVSGNSLATDVVRTLTAGSDVKGPRVATAEPKQDEGRVSPNTNLELWFDEAVKNATISRATVTLTDGTNAVHLTPAISPGGTNLLVTPSRMLAPSTTYTLRLAGGYDGIQDRAGNPLSPDFTLRFTTSGSTEIPSFVVTPPPGASAVPVTSRITAIASGPLDPTTLTPSTFKVKTVGGDTVSGVLTLGRGNRAIVFRPLRNLPSNEPLRVTLVGGYRGIRLANGNWKASDEVVSFGVGFHSDSIDPELDLTLDGIAATRNRNLVVPPSGFVIDTSAFDPGNVSVDPTTLVLKLTGPGSVPSPDELFGLGSFTPLAAATRIDDANSLPEGDYTLTATVKDLTGNESPAKSIHFSVAAATTGRRPFERTQLVWVRFDADREGRGKGDGVADFDQDLIDYGLNAAGDPLGRNAFVRKIVVDGVLKVANDLFHRAADSSPKAGSVNIRLTTRRPCRAPHMQIAVGGADPSGASKRHYGDDSTGILGRALYDYRNSVPNENNAGTSPGLGVFAGELFLFQARLYLDLFPFFITTFGRTFRGLSPHMGGTPAGTHSLDAKVLADGFDYNKATPNERARYDAIMNAADDLAVAVGVVLAHEIGHSVGLVAPGPPSAGLHGDQTLHNATTGISDVMSAVVGYESLVSVDFEFRPLNLAYLRERVLLE